MSALAVGEDRWAWQCPNCGAPLVAVAEERRRCPICGFACHRRDGLWHLDDTFRPSGYALARHGGLTAIEERHFWFAARDRLVERWLERHAEPGGRRVLDLGCGSGRFLAQLAAAGWRTVGVDGHPEPLLTAARRATRPSLLIQADVERVPLADAQFDVVLALDVLEHVEPTNFLGEARRLLRPGGGLLLTVPAMPLLWSRTDELAGHRCRYTMRRLRRELLAGELAPIAWTHYQCLLLPALGVVRLLGRRSERPIERRPPAWLDRLCARINSWEVERFGHRSLPWGSSLVVWARRSPT